MDPNWSNFAIYLYMLAHYNTDWIANTEIALDPNNSVIKSGGVVKLYYLSDFYILSTILIHLKLLHGR